MAGAALTGMSNTLASAQAPKSAPDWDEKNGAAPPAPDAPQALPLRPGAIPIIDSHIHLFDQTRPVFSGYTGGLCYRALNKPSTPAMYAALARPAGIVGAIVVESAAQFIDDNLWYLEVSRDNSIMVGVSGNIDPGSNDFAKYLNHFHRDPLFRAIRSSRFYTSDGGKVALNPAQVANLKLLAQADLALDTANPSMPLMQANVLLADATGVGAVIRIVFDVVFGIVGVGIGLLVAFSLGGPIATWVRNYALLFYGGRYQALGDLLDSPPPPPPAGHGTPEVA